MIGHFNRIYELEAAPFKNNIAASSGYLLSYKMPCTLHRIAKIVTDPSNDHEIMTFVCSNRNWLGWIQRAEKVCHEIM